VGPPDCRGVGATRAGRPVTDEEATGPGVAATHRLATIGQRAAARLLDALIIGVPAFVLVLATSEIDEARNTVRTPLWAQLVATGIAALYEVVLIRRRGQTVGKRALGIEVIRVTDGRHPDWSASTMRYLLPVLPALVPVPGLVLLSPVIYLVAVLDPMRRGWHDRAAGTIVVEAERRKAPVAPVAGRGDDPSRDG
jgi:uncharacterized RDD family membrane protein YckC